MKVYCEIFKIILTKNDNYRLNQKVLKEEL